jgi:signal transduction histidine kinase
MAQQLTVLVVIASLPLVAIAVGLLVWSAVLSRYAAQSAFTETSRALASAVDREIAQLTSSLYQLAVSPAFDCTRSADFRSQATALAERHGGWIVLAGPDGRPRMGTRPEPGRPAASDEAKLRPAFQPSRPGVSDVVFDPVSGSRAVFVTVPVTGAASALCWLSIGLPAEHFSRLIEPDARRPSWRGVLIDSSHRVIATSDGSGLAAGRAPDWFAVAAAGRAGDAVQGESWPEAGRMQLAFHRVGGERWTVVAAAPSAQLRGAWLGWLVAGMAAVLGVAGLSLWGAAACAGRLGRQIAQTLLGAQESIRQRRIEQSMRLQAEAEKAAAERADRSKDAFLATLSHELRGALTAVIGWLEIGRSHLGDETTLRKALDVALRNARTQARIMDDLLDVSRILAGKFSIERRPVELSRLAREALDAVRPAAEERRVELRARVHQPVFIEGDRDRMLQVVSNLLGNAIKFNRPGGWVELALECSGRQARLIVADNGAGIEAAALPHIFERSWQDEARVRRGGLGLGLALVHHIVELHRGCVYAESDGCGKGARFTLELPALAGLAAVLPPEAPHADEPIHAGLNGLGVVAVDRNGDTLGWLQHLLASHGAMTWQAQSVEQALALVEREHADVMISDFSVAGERHDLVKALQARRFGRRVAAVAFSSQPTDEECRRALAAGYDSFVAKPCDPAVLLRAVKAAVERRAP